MQKKYDIVIADTSCLILLTKIGEIDILKELFGTIHLTQIVANEFGQAIPDWISIIDNSSDKTIELLAIDLDLGEASSIAYSLSTNNSLMILDDKKARKPASKLNLNFVGTIGLLLKAKGMNILNSKNLRENLLSSGFYFSQDLIDLFE